MAPLHRNKTISPYHILGRSLVYGKVESAEQVRQGEVEFRVRETVLEISIVRA